MEIYCGVCARRILSASENKGSFQVSGNFGGWDAPGGRDRIDDTCEDCAPVLREAVRTAAKKIASRLATSKRIAALVAEIAIAKKRQEDLDREKADFERYWREHRRKKG